MLDRQALLCCGLEVIDQLELLRLLHEEIAGPSHLTTGTTLGAGVIYWPISSANSAGEMRANALFDPAFGGARGRLRVDLSRLTDDSDWPEADRRELR